MGSVKDAVEETKKDDLAISLGDSRINGRQGQNINKSLKCNITLNDCCDDLVKKKWGKIDQKNSKGKKIGYT